MGRTLNMKESTGLRFVARGRVTSRKRSTSVAPERLEDVESIMTETRGAVTPASSRGCTVSTRFYYTAAQMMSRAGRKSPNAAHQLLASMPAPDAVVVAKLPTRAWTLDSWRRFAVTRSPALAEDLQRTIEELQREETELYRKYASEGWQDR